MAHPHFLRAFFASISLLATASFAFQIPRIKRSVQLPLLVLERPYVPTQTQRWSTGDIEIDKVLAEAEDAVAEADAAMAKMSEQEKEEKIGNLVSDDEWMGLGMEISELVRVAIVEEVKKNTADFIGKDEYKVGDISKEIDARVKDEIANMRGKDEYELGDLTQALDALSKQLTCELTGKEDYEAGDLSAEINKRVKESVTEFCGKPGQEYELGDLSKEIDKRVKSRVSEFTAKHDYTFGDISREVENSRKAWVKGFLGEEAAENYQFGDVTRKALANFTGKDEYQFGDMTKKVLGNLFGPRKRGGKQD